MVSSCRLRVASIALDCSPGHLFAPANFGPARFHASPTGAVQISHWNGGLSQDASLTGRIESMRRPVGVGPQCSAVIGRAFEASCSK